MTARQIPAFTESVLAPKQNKYCVCVFILNEGERFLAQLAKMKPLSKQIDIVIADGGSTDGSVDTDFLKKNGVNTLLIKTGPGKLGAQMRMAFGWALNRGYAGVLVVDGNNKDSIENIPDFIQELNNGLDYVQGSRFVPGGQHKNTPLSRLLGLKLLHAPLLNLAARFHYTDTTNGFRAYSSKFLQDERVNLFRDIFTGYELHYYLAVRAARLGYRIKEIPVSRIYPAAGKTPTKISPLRGNLNVLYKLLKTVLGGYN